MAIVRDLMDHPNPEVAATVAGAQQAASSSRAASTRDAGPSATISSIHATSSELTEPTGGAPCARDGISLKEGVDTSAIHTGDGSSPLKVDASSVLGGGGGGGGGRDADPEGAAAGTSQAFVHVSIFPDDKFHFSGECHVLVMAEDKRAAERCLHDLQVLVCEVIIDSIKRNRTTGSRSHCVVLFVRHASPNFLHVVWHLRACFD